MGGRKRKGCKKNRKKCRKNNKKKSSTKGTNINSTIKRIYSRSGNSFHLAVLQNGTVKGEVSHKRSDYTLIEVKSIDDNGIVTLRGLQAKLYVCVGEKGKIRAQENYIKAKCTFQSVVRDNQQTTYKALAKCGKRRCRGFLNLNKKGQVKNATKHRNYLDQQTHFLDRIPRRRRRRRRKRRRRHINIQRQNFSLIGVSAQDVKSAIREE